jgi:hypothetical protein
MVWPGADGFPTPDPGQFQGSTKRPWYRPRWWWSIPGAALVLAGVAGGVLATQSNPAPTHANATASQSSSGANSNTDNSGAVGTGYLATESDGVIFLQWTQTGNELSGSAQYDTLQGTPPNATVNTQTISVTGSLNGSQITLSFNGGAEVFGTISGGSFTVNFPQRDGQLAPVQFAAATAPQFNQALARLQGNTGSANQNAAAAQQIQKEQGTIDGASQAVSKDISGIQNDASQLSQDLGGFGGNLATMQKDLATVAAQEQTVITEAHNGTDPNQVCSDSDTDQSDADTVGSDGDTVSSTADTIEGDINTLRHDISGLQGDFSTLQSDQAVLPSYRDGAPGQGAVNQAQESAQGAINAALGQANGEIGQANSYEQQATADAAAAAQAGNCAGPASQYTQPTIG